MRSARMKPGSPVRRTLRAAFAACAFGAAGATAQPKPAQAQPKDDAAGLSKTERDALRGHFRQGLALQAAGNWTAALAEYQTVAKEVATPQVNFNIAECQEKLGQL